MKGLFKRWTQRIPKLRLSHQLLGFFAFVVLVPLLLLSVSIYSINQKAVKKQVTHFTEHTAQAIYDELRMELSWQVRQSRLAVDYWILLSGHSDKTRFFRHNRDILTVATYEASGQRLQVASAPGKLPFERYLPVKLSSSVTAPVLALHRQGQVRKGSYLLEIRLPSAQGRSVVLIKSFDYLDKLMSEQFQSLHNGFVIVDNRGAIIAGPPVQLGRKLAALDWARYQALKPGMFREFSAQNAIYDRWPDAPSAEEKAEIEKIFIKMPRVGWGLIIESPYSVKQNFILRARTQSVALVFLCVVLIVILGSLYSRGINRNFRQLTKGIKAMGDGRYSRKIRLITKSWTPYEIVYLTAEFNRMAHKISSAWDNIQQLNQELMFKNEQDEFMAKATRRLHQSLDPQVVMQTAVDTLASWPGVSGAMLFLTGSPTGFDLAAQALGPDTVQSIQGFDLLLNEDRQTAMTRCLETQNPLFPHRALYTGLPSDLRVVFFPISYQDMPLGVMLILEKRVKPTEDGHFDDTLLLNILCSQVGVALQQARQWKQLEQANEQLAKLDELKSNLIDTVSHELRTPLTNIKGYTSRLIRNEKAASSDAQLDRDTKIKSLKIIKQQADRLTRMVEDLLVIPELERGEGIRVYPDRVDLSELIHRSVAFVQDKAAREILLTEALPDSDVLADPDRMEQVILNLLDNAIKYASDESTPITLATRLSDDRNFARIEVFNVCEPISQEQLAQLFTKFKRLDERLTRTTRGTGLGLFITRGLVEAMGGKIWIEGDEGFRVVMEIPLAEVTASDSVVSSSSAVLIS